MMRSRSSSILALIFLSAVVNTAADSYGLACCEDTDEECSLPRFRVIPKSPTPPTYAPTRRITNAPTTAAPSIEGEKAPSETPSESPVEPPTSGPTGSPTAADTAEGEKAPSEVPSAMPVTNSPTSQPTQSPTKSPDASPTPEVESCPEGWTILNTFNLLTTGSLSTNSDVEGTTFIGGDLVSSEAATFGAHLSSTTDVTFSVAGAISSGHSINIIKGNMAHNPALTSSITNDGDWLVSGRTFEIQDENEQNAAFADQSITSTASEYTTQLRELSDFLASLEETSANSIEKPSDQPAPFNFIINDFDEQGVAVFNIQDSDLFENSKVQQIEVKTNASPSLVVINVAGTSVSWQYANFVGSWLTGTDGRSKTIWNFYEATSVNFGSKGMGGAVVAPDATLTIANPIDGATAVKELQATSEVHFPLLSIACPYTNGYTRTASTETSTPTDSPTGTPPVAQAASASGGEYCCSGNFKSCKSGAWCNQDEQNCSACSGLWLVLDTNPSCLAKNTQCNNSNEACCLPATCQGGEYYKQCKL